MVLADRHPSLPESCITVLMTRKNYKRPLYIGRMELNLCSEIFELTAYTNCFPMENWIKSECGAGEINRLFWTKIRPLGI
jgi:hypothetical protein